MKLRALRSLLLATALLYGGCKDSSVRTPLVGELADASAGPILAPNEPLGHSRSAAFLTGPWDESRETEERILPQRYGGFRFYCDVPLAVRVDLEGRLPEKDGEGRQPAAQDFGVHFNGQPVPGLRLTSDWSSFHLDLPASSVRVGLNTLEISGGSASAWRRFGVSSPARGKSASAGQQLGAYAQTEAPQTLSVPYADRLVFPLRLTSNPMSLVVDRVEPWLDSGAAPPGEEWGLKVELQSEEDRQVQSWFLEGAGPHRLSLPPGKDRPANLALTPQLDGETPPLPGQLGLTLFEPVLEGQGSLSATESPPNVASPGHRATRVIRIESARQPGTILWPGTQAYPGRAPASAPTADGDPSPVGIAPYRPNVLIYLVDTLRADHLGCYGYKKSTSPNIDALAADGILFEDVTAESSWTKPSTATILTGLPSSEHGVLDFADMLGPETQTLAEEMKAGGYMTAAFLSNPLASPLYHFDQGFQTVAYRPLSDSPAQTADFLEWLRKRPSKDGKPFFAYLHTLDPPLPYQPPPALARRFSAGIPVFGNDEAHSLMRDQQAGRDGTPQFSRRLRDMVALYDGEVAGNDHSFGRVVGGLKSMGLYDDTLIVVIADHGEELYDRKALGHVHSLFQELIRVPWLIKMPGQSQAGTRVKGNWRHLDLAPTVLACCGLPIPRAMSGRAFNGQQAEADSPASLTYVHTGRGATVTNQTSHTYLLEAQGLRLGKYELMLTEAQLLNRMEPVALFDLEQDPAETVNLAYERPVTTLALTRLARMLGKRSGPPVAAPTAPPDLVRKSLQGLQYLR